jgi:Carboxypeptidase regulatory-like domain
MRVVQSCITLILLVLSGSGLHVWAQPGAKVPSSDSVGAVSAGAPQTQVQTTDQALLATIRGVVESKDGEVYEGARVALTLAGPGAPLIKTQATGSDGAFSFSDVPPGAFKLAVSSDGFATQTLSGILQPGENYNAQTIVLFMTTATSEVQVTASQRDIEVEQFHEEVQQRVLGIIPNFYVTYAPNAPPLTTRQKYVLAWKSSIDPVAWVAAGGFAGVEQAENSFSGYGQGAQGYAKRFGASYADAFIGTMLGGAILPSVFKQDPRYFYKGTGTVRSRVAYAIANAVICKGDNGHWQFDYSGIMGSLAAGGIANLYYPAKNRDGVGLTLEESGLGVVSTAIGNIFQEFVVRKLTPKVPHYAELNQ